MLIKIYTQICAIVSMMICFSVVLTMIIFPSMRKNKIFMEIVAMIAITNIMGNIPYSMAIFPKDGTALCRFQGFCDLYFFPVSWMFTLILAYLLRGLACTGRLKLLRHHIHIICWGFPFIVTMLRLSTNTFGVEPSFQYNAVCSYGGDPESGFLWQVLTYCGLVLLISCLIFYWLLEIWYLQWSKSDLASSPTFAIAKESLFWYPVILILCWAPYALYVISQGAHPSKTLEHPKPIDFLLRSLKNLAGGLSAMIFFWKSKEARTRWGRLFMGSSHLASNQRADESSNIYVDDEVDYDDCELPSDDTIVTRILSVRVSPASVAVALQAQGSLDIENNVIGLAGRVDGFPSDSVLSGLHDGSRPTDGGIELSSMSPAFGTESSIADDASATAPDSASDLASDSTHESSGALVSPHCPASPAACPLDPAVSTAST